MYIIWRDIGEGDFNWDDIPDYEVKYNVGDKVRLVFNDEWQDDIKEAIKKHDNVFTIKTNDSYRWQNGKHAYYRLEEIRYEWFNEMIEGLVGNYVEKDYDKIMKDLEFMELIDWHNDKRTEYEIIREKNKIKNRFEILDLRGY